MKKTLLISALMSMVGLAQAEHTTINTATTGEKTIKYADGLTLGQNGTLEKEDGAWLAWEINGLDGSGTIRLARNTVGGGSAQLLWLHGTCDEFTGTIDVGSSVSDSRIGATALILGDASASTSLGKATVKLGATAGKPILALVQDASIATTSGNFSIRNGAIRHIDEPQNFSTAKDNDTGIPASTSENAVTLTLGKYAIESTTLEKGVNLKLTANGNIKNSTVNSNITVAKGTLQIFANNVYAAGSRITVSNGAKLDFDWQSTHKLSALTLESGSEMLVRYNTILTGLNDANVAIDMAKGSLISLYGGTVKGNITISEAATIGVTTRMESSTVSGTITGNGILTLGGTLTNAWEVASAISDKVEGGNLSLVMNSSSTITLSGDNTYTGGTTIQKGTLQLASATALGVGDVTVTGGNLAFGSSLSAATIRGALTLNSGVTITLNEDHTGTLTTSGLTLEGNATFNGNLEVNGGKLTFADNAVLTMGCDVLTMGCDVTIGNMTTVVLTQTMVDTIADGGRVLLFDGVDHAALGDNVSFEGAEGVTLTLPSAYHLVAEGNKIYVTPEPATATLSLLALAGLCARRRRR